MMNKLKCYVLIVSREFPMKHPDVGKKTNFILKIKIQQKIHTIRLNYLLWKKRIDEINAGKAYLSLRYWTGKPYKSKHKEFRKLYEVGIEKIESTILGWFINDHPAKLLTEDLAKNDGLSFAEFAAWFNPIPDEPLAIIHFTDFRYETKAS